jgi:hypothetical protein
MPVFDGPRAAVLSLLGAVLLSAAMCSSAQAQLLIGRIAFSDFDKPEVSILELESGKVSRKLRVADKRARLDASSDGRYVFISTGTAASRVQVLDTGVLIESHDDHWHVDKQRVRLLNYVATGAHVSHVKSGHGFTSLFFDGSTAEGNRASAKAILLDHSRLARNRTIMAAWHSPDRQHGMAVPLDADAWAVTVPDRTTGISHGSLPSAVQIIDAANGFAAIPLRGTSPGEFVSCPQVHGHAILDNVHAFGCGSTSGQEKRGGLLLFDKSEGGWGSRTLDYPDERRVSTLKAETNAQYLVGSYGQTGRRNALLRVKPTAVRLDSLDVWTIEGVQEPCQFEFTEDGRNIVNLLGDGTLRVYEIAPVWRELRRVAAVSAFDCSPRSVSPRSMLGIIGGSAIVTDPTNGRIRRFAVHSLELLLDWNVKGKPEGLTVASGRQ